MSIIVDKFIPATYTHPGILPRRKFQKRDSALLPMFCAEAEPGKVVNTDLDADPEIIGTFEVVGECSRINPMGGSIHAAECVEITLTDGTVVPACRLKGGNYVFCQNFAFKAARSVAR